MEQKKLWRGIVNKRFKYYAPNNEDIEAYQQIRDKAKEFALLLIELCPDSREFQKAITKIESSVMWANASIARKSEKTI